MATEQFYTSPLVEIKVKPINCCLYFITLDIFFFFNLHAMNIFSRASMVTVNISDEFFTKIVF